MAESPETLSPLQRAGLALQEMRKRLETLEREKNEPIAIVGMGCRFPGADNPDAFWQLLRQGQDAVGKIPDSRQDIWGRSPANVTQQGCFLDPVDEFDADFFGISPREAATMDPQQKLLLEVSWEALEQGGIAPDRLMGSKTGMFLGISLNEFSHAALFGDAAQIDIYSATGNAISVAAGRIAYWLGLQGPALAVDTACSSALVAVHLACQSLRAQECSLAIAGGAYLRFAAQATTAMAKLNALSEDGYCRTFDAAANGYGRGEGCGAVVLKRLSDAQKDGDRILAVLRGSAVNHDGRSSGLTVPNGPAQQAVIRQALDKAGVSPQAVQYVEAHGTGTPLGDPIEVRSIGEVFGPQRETALAIGSVKTNIGHLEAAAGIAGLIKVILALQHGEIPPHLHLEHLNEQINPVGITIPTQLTPWSAEGSRLAGVSAFGFSGTNAHTIVESAPDMATETSPRPQQILCLSAKSTPALQQRIADLADYLQVHPELELADICVTANTGRSHFAQRLALLPTTRAELQDMLTAQQALKPLPERWGARSAGENAVIPSLKIGFYFPAAPLTMGGFLEATSPQFQAAIAACLNCLDEGDRAALLPVLAGKTPPNGSQSSFVTVARQVALTQLWRSWGIEPLAIAGDGMGEQVAAWAAGSLSLKELCIAAQQTPFVDTTLSAAATATLQTAGCNVALIIGAAPPTLPSGLDWLPSLAAQRADWEVLLGSLSQLYARGATILWSAVEAGQQRPPLSLPTYPFERQTYPLPPCPQTAGSQSPTINGLPGQRPSTAAETLLGERLSSPLAAVQFESYWHLDRLPLVRDHCLQGREITNLVLYLEMLQQAAMATAQRPICEWNNLLVPYPLAFSPDPIQRVQAILNPQDDDVCEFQILSQPSDNSNWLPHITGHYRLDFSTPFVQASGIDIPQVQQDCSESWDAPEFYEQMRSLGADLGPSCQVVETIWRQNGEALGHLSRSRLAPSPEHHLPLQAFDACFQILAACVPKASQDGFIILSLQQLQLAPLNAGNSPLWVYAKILTPVTDWLDQEQTATLSADLMLLDERGQCLVRAKEMQLRRWQASTRPVAAYRGQKTIGPAIVKPDLAQFSALSSTEQLETIEQYLIAALANLLQLPVSKIEKDFFLAELVDSLIAFELRNQIETDWQIRLAIEKFLGKSTISQLATSLLEQRAIAALAATPTVETTQERETVVL
ncbi:MAG: beta-ketoacyl synthase N-terminal-like domain-containing protein [Cyanobacteria bacterium P01_G01_bin.54]